MTQSKTLLILGCGKIAISRLRHTLSRKQGRADGASVHAFITTFLAVANYWDYACRSKFPGRTARSRAAASSWCKATLGEELTLAASRCWPAPCRSSALPHPTRQRYCCVGIFFGAD